MSNHIFLTGGAYIHASDMKKDTYYTQDRKGNYKPHKYGFLDKLNDLIGYGKTMDINYYYLVFKKNRKDGKILFYEGSLSGTELTELLKILPDKLLSWHSSNGIEYTFEGNKIRYVDNKPNTLRFNSDGTMARRTYIDIFNQESQMEYTFYPFPKPAWDQEW